MSVSHAHAPVMTLKEKKELAIERMDPKTYAQYQIKKRFPEPGKEFSCLKQLWGKESAWNYKAKSPTHDYGIPQRHMKHNTRAQIREFMKHPHTQIDWGLGYIEHRYDTPCGALKSWLARADKNGRGGWY